MPQAAPVPASDPVEQRLRELREYVDDDDADTSVNIQALPGSHVHVGSSADLEDQAALTKAPQWGKAIGAIVGAVMLIASAVKAWYEARKH